jgi:hypothetical protein
MLKTAKRKLGKTGWRPIGIYVSQEEYNMYMMLDWSEKDAISRKLDLLILNTDPSEISHVDPEKDQRIYSRISPEAYKKFLSFPRRGRNSWLRKEGFWPILKSSY